MNSSHLRISSLYQHSIYLVVLCFSVFGCITNCFALTSTINNNFNFGTFTQTSQQASFVLSYDGSVSSVTNLTMSGNMVAGQINITSNQNGEDVHFSPTTSEVSINGCTFTFSNTVPSLDGFKLNPGQGKYRDVNFGVTVNIDGFCEKGTYNVSGVAVDAEGTKTGALTTLIPFTVTFNDYIDLRETTSMNFGSFFYH